MSRDSAAAIKDKRHSSGSSATESPGPMEDKWQPAGTVPGHSRQSNGALLVNWLVNTLNLDCHKLESLADIQFIIGSTFKTSVILIAMKL